MSGTAMIECHAKVNLLLRVLGKEASGYHSIETLFCRIALHDSLEVRRTETGVALEVEGADLGPGEKNLAWRAAEAVLAATGHRFGVAMRLVKRIPAGGGLGGGSSNAAATLRAVNRMAGDVVPASELLQMAHRLGADVPFFLADAPLALGWGRGQRLLRLPALPPKPMLLLLPGVGIPTAEAYTWVDQVREADGPRGSIILEPASLQSWGDVARLGGNDFESAVFGRHPAVRAGFEALAGTHPFLCRMSGSGSTLFAVYRTDRDRDDAMAQLGSRFGTLVATTVL